MKEPKNICVLGNFSGRNAGDAAILECLLEDIITCYPNVHFLVPTINPGFVQRTYDKYSVQAVSLLPWHLSLKILGVPTFRAVLGSDLVIVTDAILFDLKLFNPLYNYLSTLSMVLPLAKKAGIPVVLYNVSLGPVPTRLGKKCLRRVVDSSDLIILRDTESIKVLEEIGINRPDIKMAADCALNVKLCPPERLQQIKRNENILVSNNRSMGFNISSYLDVYVRGKRRGIGKDNFLRVISEVMDRIVEELNMDIILVITQVMDLTIAEEVLKLLKYRDRVKLISNKHYSHNEIASILASVEIHVGMRTHSLIFATAGGTPVVGIIATPKNRGYLKSIEQDEQMIEFNDDFNTSNLFLLIKKTLENQVEIREKLIPIITREKERARQSAALVGPLLNGYLAHQRGI